jgi:hypothetical protein
MATKQSNGTPVKRAAAVQDPPERKQKQFSIGAYEDEIERWKVKAAADHRPVSVWIRLRLLEADARDEELAARLSEQRDGRTA